MPWVSDVKVVLSTQSSAVIPVGNRKSLASTPMFSGAFCPPSTAALYQPVAAGPIGALTDTIGAVRA